MLLNIYEATKLNQKELGDILTEFASEKVISFDIETSYGYGGRYEGEGLDPHLSTIAMMQIGTKNKQLIYDPRDPRSLGIASILGLLKNPEILIVGHNLVFEYKFIKHFYNTEITNLYDTMVVDQIINNGRKGYKYSMAAVAKARLGLDVEGKGTTQKSFLRQGTKPYTKEQLEYGAQDVIVPLLIRENQLPDIKKYKLQRCVSLEMKFTPVLGDMSLKGMHFDVDKWIEIYNKYEKEAIQHKNKLDKYISMYMEDIPTKYIDNQMDLFEENDQNKLKVNVNWDSPQQVKDIFIALNLHPQDDSGKFSTDATVLVNYTKTAKHLSSIRRNFIAKYIEYKKLRKNCTTYGKDFLKHVNPITGRVHSNYKQILNTGRISSSNPNLQNIPAGEHRKAFTAPKDYRIINADYSGQEQIILANKSKEPNLIKFYESGESDMHSYIARLLFHEIPDDMPLNEVKEKFSGFRQIAKAAGFAINYGGNGFTIATNLGVSDKTGNNVYEAYFRAFPRLKNYFKEVQQQTLFNKYIIIDKATNRICHVSGHSQKEINKIKRDALNYPIQGEAGSITKLAAIFFKQELKRLNLQDRAFITNLVHDEINVECKESMLLTVASILEESMEKAGAIWCKTVPLRAVAVVSDYWTH